MHRLQLIHTDLKPENILLVSSDYVKLPDPKDGSFSRKLPKSSAIKLIDFGSAAYHHQDRSYIVSTRHYRAPEVILGHGWSYPCDIWSVGCILVELCSGETLFQTHDNLEHLAMMDRVLGPLPRHMLERADQHAEKYVRKGGLNWPLLEPSSSPPSFPPPAQAGPQEPDPNPRNPPASPPLPHPPAA